MKNVIYFFFLATVVLLAFPSDSLAALTLPSVWSVQENYSAEWDEVYSIDADDQYLYVVGVDSINGNTDAQWRIEKRNIADGSLVFATTSNPTVGSDDLAMNVRVDDSYMYIAGTDSALGWRFEKRNLSDGSLVYATTTPGWYIDSFRIDDSSMYAFGYDNDPGNRQWRLERRNLSDGSLVYATTSNPSSGHDYSYSLAIDSSFAYLAGSDRTQGGVSTSRIEKRNLSDGSLVYTLSPDPGPAGDWAESIAIDDTYMYIGHEIYPVSGSDGYWLLAKRLLSDGSLVTSTTSNPDTGWDAPYCTNGSRRDDSYIYFCGYSVNAAWTNDSWRIEKRNASDLSLVATVSGLYPNGWWAIVRDTVIDDQVMYAVGANHPSSTADSVWQITAFNLAPAPTVSSFSPESGSVQAGEGAMTLTINGTNFTASTTGLTWKGNAKTATYVSSTQMTLELSREDTLTDGSFALVIPNDDPAGDSLTTSYTLTTPPNNTRSSGSASRRSPAPRAPEALPLTPEAVSSTPSVSAPTPPSVNPVFQFTKDLRYLQTDPDVLKLQEFLNSHGFPLASTGPGSPGQETTKFGALTKAALMRFQEANAEQILKPNNLTKGTGYFGPSTRGVVNGMPER